VNEPRDDAYTCSAVSTLESESFAVDDIERVAEDAAYLKPIRPIMPMIMIATTISINVNARRERRLFTMSCLHCW
jgi:hypothetical protein